MKRIIFLKCRIIFFALLGVGDLAATENTPLNDTGSLACGTSENIGLDCPQAEYPAQDSEFGRDLLAKRGTLKKKGGGHAGFDFTKLDQEGKPLPVDAKEWACVLDNHTGLMWEVKTTDGGLQDHNHRYTWFNPDEQTNGGHPGTRNGGNCKESECDTLSYTAAINSRGLCGHKDWRLPTMVELQSIVDYGKRLPAIDNDFFPNTPVVEFSAQLPSVEFWAMESWAGDPANAWGIDFRTGLVSYRYKNSKAHQIRLVRSSAAMFGSKTEPGVSRQ